MRASLILSVVAGIATLLIMSALATFGMPVALAQDLNSDACSLATLRGGYGFHTVNGFANPDENKPRFVPDIAAGLVIFDGAGHFTGKATDVTNGDVGPESPPFQFQLEGTYVLDPDCTGSLLEVNSGTHLEIIVVDNAREIESIQTDLRESRIFDFKKVSTGRR